MRITAGAEDGGGTRRITLQVMDRRQADFPGRWIVAVWIATAAGGDPGGTQSVAVVTGYAWRTVVADQAFEFVTDADGTIELDVTEAGAATRVFVAAVLGLAGESEAVTWA